MRTFTYVTGVFDLFHAGHLHLLQTAKSLGDYLIVAIHPDYLVEQYKGRKPIFNEIDRVNIVRSIKFVDEIIIQNELNPLKTVLSLPTYRPLTMVHGDDWLPIGWDECAKLSNVEVKQIPLLEGYSSSLLVGRIKKMPLKK